MKIAQLPKFKDHEPVLTCHEDMALPDAVKNMVNSEFGSILVTNTDGSLKGIVTERDLMIKVVNQGLDPADLKVKDIMTSPVKTAKIDDLVIDSLHRMSNGRFRHLPIIDNDNRPQGMVSQGDFVAYTWGELVGRFAENARATIQPFYQPMMIIGAVLIYTLILIAAFQYI